MSVECHVELCCMSYSKLAIICTYRPPTGDHTIFFNTITNALRVVLKKFQYVVFCGDLNVDYSKNSNNKNILNDIFQSFQMKVTSNGPTRLYTNYNGQTSSSSIDYISTNLPNGTYECKTVNPFIADHFAQIINVTQDLSTDTTKAKNITFRSRNTSDANVTYFVQNVNKIDWSFIYIEDVNLAFDMFVRDLTWCIESSCPVVNINLNKIKINTWYTQELENERKELEKIYWLSQNLGCDRSRQIYRSKRKQYKKNIRKSKLNHFTKKIKESENKTKETWKIINNALGKGKEKINTINIIHDNQLVTDPEVITNTFAEYFSSVANLSVQQHFGENLSLPCTTTKLQSNTSLFVAHIDAADVKREINLLKNKRSTGVDEISVKLLKSISDFICEPLAYLINRSLNSGIFPDVLKLACVIPLYKKEDPLKVENYRQISLLSTLSKLLERLVYNIIIKYLNKLKIITPCQHGFREHMSTETASYHLLNFVYKELDEGKYVMLLMFDLSRAFDTVNTEFLCDKLFSIGIRGNLLRWIRSYLENRKMIVKYNNVKSSIKNVDLGVPQGSVLGPLLFMIYINDLPQYLSTGQVTMFADDTSITVSASTPEELALKVNCVCDELNAWSQRNRLILNNKKTVYLNFYIQKPLPPSFEAANKITFSEATKFLGTHLDCRLRWNNHIDFVCAKLNSAFYAIFQMKSSLDIEGLLSIYYSLAYSHMSNNIVSWGVSSGINRVLVSQKRLMRIIFNLQPMSSCKDCFKSKNILTVPSIFLWKCVIYVFNNKANFEEVGQCHSYGTRHGSKLLIPAHKTTTYKKSPAYNFTKIFDTLPQNLKNIKNFSSFKKQTKSFFVEKAFYSVQEFLSTEI